MQVVDLFPLGKIAMIQLNKVFMVNKAIITILMY